MLSAHHLIGDVVSLCPVDNNGASGMLAAAVIVERRLAGDVDGAAGDEQVTVGVNGICIAGTHGDGNSTAVDLDLYVQGGGFPAGVGRR